MLNKVEEFINANNLFSHKDKLLLAISGGIDSVVLLEVLINLGYEPALAHCNFNLRGKESKDDEFFVRKLAKDKNLVLYVENFDTENYALKNGYSIQMAARALRYNWFKELSDKKGFNKIVLGHHQDDQLETFFINLFRGSGITGLKGMRAHNGMLVRPLLEQSRTDIENFAAENKLQWREDSSNKKTDYLRNRIRHGLLHDIAELDHIYPQKIAESMGMIQREERLYRQLLNDYFSSTQTDDEIQSVDKEVFLKHPEGLTLLFEYLKSFGFNYEQTVQIFNALNENSGKLFNSASHQLLIDREDLQIRSIDIKNAENDVEIDSARSVLSDPLHLVIKQFECNASAVINKDLTCAMLDFDRLVFPLLLRRWKKGDRFYPIGMKGSKLISDFFTDQHLSLFEKEEVWLLVNGNQEIVWVVGHRIDDRYKITQFTKKVYQINLLK